jgi:uncharacterized membrane protein YqjE
MHDPTPGTLAARVVLTALYISSFSALITRVDSKTRWAALGVTTAGFLFVLADLYGW